MHDPQRKTLPMPNLQNVNYRLLQEYEVPDWIKKHTLPDDESKLIEEFGAGKRQRKAVNYNEEFSEGQWLKIIEQGGDPQAEAEKIRNKRKEMGGGYGDGGAPEKRRKLDGYQEEEDDYGEEEEEEDYEYKASRNRGNRV
jgi:hypothetical protein